MLMFTLTLIGVIVAIIALGYQRNQAEATRRQEETARETARRQEVGVAEWMRDLRDWASEAVEVLSEAVYASDGTQGPVPSAARRSVPRLSALIDRGRFFLPNQYTDKYGKHKLPAFRGYRHAALDPLVSAVAVLEGSVKDEKLHNYVAHNRRAVLRELQKEFVSHIQQILDPEGHNQEIARIITENQAQAEEFLKKNQAQAEKILAEKDFGHTTMGLVQHVVARLIERAKEVERLRAKEGSRRPIERQDESAPEST
jgi:hypothetical protein